MTIVKSSELQRQMAAAVEKKDFGVARGLANYLSSVAAAESDRAAKAQEKRGGRPVVLPPTQGPKSGQT